MKIENYNWRIKNVNFLKDFFLYRFHTQQNYRSYAYLNLCDILTWSPMQIFLSSVCYNQEIFVIHSLKCKTFYMIWYFFISYFYHVIIWLSHVGTFFLSVPSIRLFFSQFPDWNLSLVSIDDYISRDSCWCTMAVVARIQDHDPKAKPFLGGWRNTVTGLIYHNACTQTHGGCTTKSRITQTIAVVDAITIVVHDQAIQVEFLPDVRDKIISPETFSFLTPAMEETKPLVCQDNNSILDSVIKIQKYYR